MHCRHCTVPLEPREVDRVSLAPILGLHRVPKGVASSLVCPSCGGIYWSREALNLLAVQVGTELFVDGHVLSPEEVFFLRETLGLTRASLAERVGYSTQDVALWERTQGTLPERARSYLRDRLAETLSKQALLHGPSESLPEASLDDEDFRRAKP